MSEFVGPRPPAHQPVRQPTGTPPRAEPGDPLDQDVRATMEARFGHDFSRVRVHSDEQSAAANRQFGAIAFTTGADIYFGAGQYLPRSAGGRGLLAHELAHVVQQAGVQQAGIQQAGAQAPVQAKQVSTPGDAAEHAADAAAHAFGRSDAPPESVALGLRDALRATRSQQQLVLRAVPTWAGEFDTDKYVTARDKAKTAVGVDIDLRFKPGKYVDAELIGMVQKVTTLVAGKPGFPGNSKTIKARSVTAGADVGANIDNYETARNPLYATGAAGAKDRLADTATQAFAGQHGWRYTDKKKVLHKQDALLKDKPRIEPPPASSSQTFESTAVAIKGAQVGAYYGSVQWGWATDAAGKFTQLPLTLISKDVPSANFDAAAKLWAANPTSTGAATIGLPMILGKFSTTAGTWLLADPATGKKSNIGYLAKNTRIEVTDKGATEKFNLKAKNKWWKVTVTDGTSIGRVGWVMETMLSDVVTP